MSELLKVNTSRFPLDGSTIHQQEGWPDLIAAGPEELAKLPKPQRIVVEKRVKACKLERGLTGFVGADGAFYLFDGSPLVAQVSPKGKVESQVEWF